MVIESLLDEQKRRIQEEVDMIKKYGRDEDEETQSTIL